MSPLRLARPVPHGGSGQEESRDRLRKCTEEQRPSRTSCPRRPSAGRLAFDGAAHVHLRELRLRKTEPALFTPARDSRVPARRPLRLSRLLGRNTETRVGVLFAARAEATAGWLSVCLFPARARADKQVAKRRPAGVPPAVPPVQMWAPPRVHPRRDRGGRPEEPGPLEASPRSAEGKESGRWGVRAFWKRPAFSSCPGPLPRPLLLPPGTTTPLQAPHPSPGLGGGHARRRKPAPEPCGSLVGPHRWAMSGARVIPDPRSPRPPPRTRRASWGAGGREGWPRR